MSEAVADEPEEKCDNTGDPADEPEDDGAGPHLIPGETDSHEATESGPADAPTIVEVVESLQLEDAPPEEIIEALDKALTEAEASVDGGDEAPSTDDDPSASEDVHPTGEETSTEVVATELEPEDNAKKSVDNAEENISSDTTTAESTDVVTDSNMEELQESEKAGETEQESTRDEPAMNAPEELAVSDDLKDDKDYENGAPPGAFPDSTDGNVDDTNTEDIQNSEESTDATPVAQDEPGDQVEEVEDERKDDSADKPADDQSTGATSPEDDAEVELEQQDQAGSDSRPAENQATSEETNSTNDVIAADDTPADKVAPSEKDVEEVITAADESLHESTGEDKSAGDGTKDGGIADTANDEGTPIAESSEEPSKNSETPVETTAEKATSKSDDAEDPPIEDADAEGGQEVSGEGKCTDEAPGDEAETKEAAKEDGNDEKAGAEIVPDDAGGKEATSDEALANTGDEDAPVEPAQDPVVTAVLEVPSLPDTSKTRRRKKHRKPEREQKPLYIERDRQGSILNGHKTRLERKKEEKGLFTFQFGRAIDKAKEEQAVKHDTAEYKAKQEERRVRREAREERDREERRKEREERRAREEAEEAEKRRKRKEERERAAAEAEAAERRRVRRPSFPESNSSGRGQRPALLKRMTTGESDTGSGSLLMFNPNKGPTRDETPRSSPESKTSHHRRGSHTSESVSAHGSSRASDEKRPRDRPTNSRHGSSRSQRSSDRYDDVPAIKLARAVRNILVN